MRGRASRAGGRPWLVPLLVACLAGLAGARDDEDETGRGPDPYTRGEREALDEAGYVALDGLPWAGDHTTRDVREVLGAVPLVWIETEHFRLGSSLPAIGVEREERDRVRDELDRLGDRLPRVKTRSKTLDPWLRAHLYAQRLEELYDEVQALLGVTDADLAHEPGPDGDPPPRGQGPYLGMGDKFCVLLLEREASLARYGARWGLTSQAAPQTLYYQAKDAMGFVTCSEWFAGDWENDTALACHVRWYVGQNLLRGYQGYFHESTLWLRQGLGHVLSREVDPRFNTMPRVRETVDETFERWDWAPSVRARVGFGLAPSLAEMALWDPLAERTFAEHRMAWSRVDWLLRDHAPEQVATFFREACARLDVGARVPTREEVAAHEEAALREAFGFGYDRADEAWAEWVEDEYPRK